MYHYRLRQPGFRNFSYTATRRNEYLLNSLDTLTEEELMLQESGVLIGLIQQAKLTVRLVRRFANEVVAPKVREMDEKEMMEPEIIKNLFEQGVRTIFSFYCAPHLILTRFSS